MAQAVTFRILDRFSLIHAGQEVTLKGQKQKALLAWFCLTGDARITRERLADLLWSASAPDKARGSLRNMIHLLPSLGEGPAATDLVVSDRESLLLGAARPVCTVMAALMAWDSGQADAFDALSLAEADTRFAADLFGLDPEFDSFLTERRGRYLAGLADQFRLRLASAGGQPASRALAQMLRDLVPEDEQATRHLMRLEIEAGNNAAALAHYDRLWRVLDRDFDIEPSEETQALAVMVKMQAPLSGDPGHAALPAGSRVTIFLQPFPGNTLPMDDQIALGAIQAELVAALFAVQDWVTVEASPGLPLPARSGCYELRGSVSAGLRELRLILMLKDLGTGELIWTWPLSLNRADLIRNSGFAVQRIAARLTGKVEAHYLSGMQAIPDAALADYAKLSRARWLMRDWTAESDRRAELLLRSVAASGEWGLRARVGLVEILNSRALIFPGLEPPHAGVPEALVLAQGCVAQAPDYGDAWLALGWSSLLLDQTEAAALAAETVADLSHSNPRRLAAAAEMLALSGEVARGADLSQMVGILDPGVCRVTLGYRAAVALLSRDYALAVDLVERSGGAIVFSYAYGAAAAELGGDRTRALEFWALFCADLAEKWQGEVLPDPLDWLISTTSMRAGKGLDWVVEALGPVHQAALMPMPRQNQRQDRVV